MATYAEKLLDVRWQKKRSDMLILYCWICNVCKATTKTLHVHHKKYIYGRDPWDYHDDVFEILCHECHATEHKIVHEPKPISRVIGELYKPPEVITLMDEQIKALSLKLTENITDELQEEILKNLMYLQTKKRELLKYG